MGAVRCPAVTAEWSPSGRHLLTATTAPRMRVDNVFKVFTYYGKEVRRGTKEDPRGMGEGAREDREQGKDS
jgi:uncharacterized protein with WD repeat